MLIKGTIIQSISGFYYIEAADAVYECKARGNFRKNNLSPLVGDTVDFEMNGERGTVVKIYDRKNFLIRPPVANIDILFIVASADKPRPNLFIIDKLTAFAVYHNIRPVIVFSKTDLSDVSQYVDIYEKAGFTVITCSALTGEGFDEFRELVKDKICAFTGNSGVGKSSILNAMLPELKLETNEISDKLGRGRHTTRSVKLYKMLGGYIADTPGFSSVDFETNGEKIFKDELPDCFPEFSQFVENCKFSLSCSHTADKGCAVVDAVKNGLIPSERHESYCKMYEEVKSLKKWEL